MHQETLQAFVLSNADYGESDRIVSLFTLEHGRLKGFARAARSSRRRFGPALEPFSRISLQIKRKEGLSWLISADIVALYAGIRRDLSAIAHGTYASELIECLAPEGVPLPRLYRLFASYLEHLDTAGGGAADRCMFEINLLNILGYRPSLEQCCRCGKSFGSAGALLLTAGELSCCFCAPVGRRINSSSLLWLGSCLQTSRFGGVSTVDDELLDGAAVVLSDSIAAHSGRTLRSMDFLKQHG